MTERHVAPAFLIAAALAVIAAVLCLSLYRGDLTPTQAWFSLVQIPLAGALIWVAPRDRTAQVACLLLASLAVLFSRINPSEVQALPVPGGGNAGAGLELFWTFLITLFPFVFLHFALTFPVTSSWIEAHPWRQLWIYLPVGVLLSMSLLNTEEWTGLLAIFTIPAGFLLGLYVLARQYRYALTGSEKNRLRVVLIGCLAGGLPRLVSAVGSAQLPAYLLDLADILLPLFPLSLAVAILKESFFEIGVGFQRVLVYSLAGTGIVNVFFLAHTAASFGFSDENALNPLSTALSALAALAVSLPLRRWARGYVEARFEALQSPALDGKRQTAPSREGSEFSPLFNPFVVGNPVRSSEMFFGRREEFEFIRRRLANEREGCAIVLCGDRRTGKTSILYQILNGRLGEGFLPVFLDMQGVVVNDDREFTRILARAVGQACADAGRRLPDSLIAAANDYLSLTAYLDALLQQPGLGRLVLLIDEYELVDSKVERGSLSPEIYPYLNSLLERFGRLSLVLTGSRPLEADSPWEVLLSRSTYREVSFLSRSDARDLLTVPLRGSVQYRVGTLDRFWRLARGNPFFTQLLGQTLIDVLNERRSSIAGAAACEQTVERILEHPPPQLLYHWSAFSSAEKMVLSALAASLKRPDLFLPPARVERMLRALPGPAARELDDVRIRMLLEALRTRSVLDRDQTRYRFTMDLMRLWVRNERNLWNVLNEIEAGEPDLTQRRKDAKPESL